MARKIRELRNSGQSPLQRAPGAAPARLSGSGRRPAPAYIEARLSRQGRQAGR
jgi:hypothetical protein